MKYNSPLLAGGAKKDIKAVCFNGTETTANYDTDAANCQTGTNAGFENVCNAGVENTAYMVLCKDGGAATGPSGDYTANICATGTSVGVVGPNCENGSAATSDVICNAGNNF